MRRPSAWSCPCSARVRSPPSAFWSRSAIGTWCRPCGCTSTGWASARSWRPRCRSSSALLVG